MHRLAVAALAALTVSSCEPAFAQDQDRAAWFKSLKQPGTGMSCCDISDCRATEAGWRDGGWVAIVRGVERRIPSEKVLTAPHSIDGEAYVCASNNLMLQPEQAAIYCFVPPTMGF